MFNYPVTLTPDGDTLLVTFADVPEAITFGTSVEDALAQAVDVAQSLAGHPTALTAMVQAATAFSSAHRGAVDKTAAAVLALLDQQGVDAL